MIPLLPQVLAEDIVPALSKLRQEKQEASDHNQAKVEAAELKRAVAEQTWARDQRWAVGFQGTHCVWDGRRSVKMLRWCWAQPHGSAALGGAATGCCSGTVSLQ
jgi:hypothetical protein